MYCILKVFRPTPQTTFRVNENEQERQEASAKSQWKLRMVKTLFKVLWNTDGPVSVWRSIENKATNRCYIGKIYWTLQKFQVKRLQKVLYNLSSWLIYKVRINVFETTNNNFNEISNCNKPFWFDILDSVMNLCFRIPANFGILLNIQLRTGMPSDSSYTCTLKY